jgi:hypothetical protein
MSLRRPRKALLAAIAIAAALVAALILTVNRRVELKRCDDSDAGCPHVMPEPQSECEARRTCNYCAKGRDLTVSRVCRDGTWQEMAPGAPAPDEQL